MYEKLKVGVVMLVALLRSTSVLVLVLVLVIIVFGPVAHPAPHKMRTGSLTGKSGQGMELTTHPI